MKLIPVGTMTDQELLDASAELVAMLTARENKLEQKRPRHVGINFANSNPAFEQLKTNIEQEIKKRKL